MVGLWLKNESLIETIILKLSWLTLHILSEDPTRQFSIEISNNSLYDLTCCNFEVDLGQFYSISSIISLTHALYRVRAIKLVMLFPSGDVGGVPEDGAGVGGWRNGVGMGKGGHQGHVGSHPLDRRVAHARPQVRPPSLSLSRFLIMNDPTLIKGTFTRV